jgi:Cyclic nucleotide-binding domain/Tetratricopeptide repeat
LSSKGGYVALGFGRSKDEDVVSLIAAKNYGRAIEVLRTQLKKRGASPTLRKQLADVLILSGKTPEAIALLLPLADQFAVEGFAAKAVAVLKKIQKLDPGRRDVEERLARLIQEKQREAAVLPLSAPAPEIGMEEIGIEPSVDGPLGAPSAPSSVPAAEDRGGELEIGFGAQPSLSAPAEPSAPQVPRPRAEPPPAPPPSFPDASPVLSPPPQPLPALATPELSSPTPGGPPPPGETRGAEGPTSGLEPPEEIADYDLLYEDDEADAEAEEVEVEALPVELLPETEPGAMTDGAFTDELMSLVDSAFQEAPGGAQTGAKPTTASQIVVSPLFRDFAVDEMVAVIHGLKLLSFERGEVILREGDAGGRLYTLTSGRVRAFRKDPATGRQTRIGDLREGAFFGEMSILTGQPRMASVVALTRCELLELDRATLDDITKSHPHVWDVLREFAEKRFRTRR